MCLCEKCEGLDEWCCSFERKLWFFSIFSLGMTVFCVILIYAFRNIIKIGPIYGLTAITSIHLIAAITVIISIKKSMDKLFLIGLIFSSIAPYTFILTIFWPIMHTLFIIIGCRHITTEPDV